MVYKYEWRYTNNYLNGKHYIVIIFNAALFYGMISKLIKQYTYEYFSLPNDAKTEFCLYTNMQTKTSLATVLKTQVDEHFFADDAV